MALTPEIRTPQSGVLATVSNGITSSINIPTSNTLAIYNVPAEEIRASTIVSNVLVRWQSQVDTTQGALMVVCKGLASLPHLKAWGYTLDGHDFFVLKLGNQDKTLVYDVSTEMWSWWSSPGRASWRATTGMNWRSAGSTPASYGSNVIVGDDSSGTLWVLDPEQGVDDRVTDDNVAPFYRVATAQMVTRGKEVLPVFSVYLTASLGTPALTANTVQLEYSDDQGRSFVTAQLPQVSDNGDFTQEFEWRSLGQVKAPGRLFRVTDNGSFTRIDGLNVNEG